MEMGVTRTRLEERCAALLSEGVGAEGGRMGGVAVQGLAGNRKNGSSGAARYRMLYQMTSRPGGAGDGGGGNMCAG